MSLDLVVAKLLADMRDRALVTNDDPPQATPALAVEINWTSRTTRREGVPHVTRAQAAAMLRMRDPRTREHHWKRLHQSVRAALIRNGLLHRDLEPTKLGELVRELAATVLGPVARGEGGKPPRAFANGSLRRRV